MRVVRVDYAYLLYLWLAVATVISGGGWEEGRNQKSTEIRSWSHMRLLWLPPTVQAFSSSGNHAFLLWRVPVAALPSSVRLLPEQQRRQNHQRHSADTAAAAALGAMIHRVTRLELRMAPFGRKFAALRSSREYPASLCLSSNNNDDDDDDDLFVEAEDFEALQALFARYCDSEGLITKKSFLSIPMIADLLVSGKRMRCAYFDTWCQQNF
jgi:hypothetical protein